VIGFGGVFLLFWMNFNPFLTLRMRFAQCVLYRAGSCRRSPCEFLASETTFSTGNDRDIVHSGQLRKEQTKEASNDLRKFRGNSYQPELKQFQAC
jgi:hypothetical protein